MLSACLVCILCVAPALAAAVQCSSVEFRGARSTVCRVDMRSEHLKLFLSDTSGKPFNFFSRIAQALAVHGEQLTLAMNAGIYREDYKPVGLLVIDGHQIHRLNLASGFGNFYMKPNGVFVVSPSGARIVASPDYPALADPAWLATQSGPLLVQGRQVNPSLNPQGTSRLIRNGVGVVSTRDVVFVVSEDPVSFYEFALLFRDRLNATEALYLDGNVSSLYAPSIGRDDERIALGPILGVTAPTP